MKKLIATTLVCTAFGLAAYAQGTVNFQNIAGTAVNAPVLLTDGTKASTGYMAALLAGPTASSMSQIATASVTSGYFLGGVQTINGISPGGTADFLIEIWNSASYSSFAAAQIAGNSGTPNAFAWSNGGGALTVKTGDPTTTPAGLPGSLLALGTTPLTLNAVPATGRWSRRPRRCAPAARPRRR